ncbi:tyrosine-protein phosphatase [Promicromonospora sp. NPDC057138]|uniref:tyrosine-protein phosphatase n=1 Tax=Promicromonospora sp. NPDC057138 TaxID=3346031 RepID=UPI00362DEA14
MTDYTPLHLDWPGCLNVRDLGGLPLTGGGAVRERVLVRSDSPSFLTDDGVAAATAYGLSRIIDLRRPDEIEQEPSRLAGLPAHMHLPVQAPGDPVEGPWVHLYAGLLDRRPELFARAVGAVADAPEGPVLVHCAAGKDRTGLVVALALSLVGADVDALADDYEITNQRLAPRYAEPDERDVVAGREVPPTRHVILGALEHLRTRHGSIEAYLARGGLTPGHVRALRTRLLERD